MKTKQNRSYLSMGILFALLMSVAPAAFAQMDPLLSETEDLLNNEQLDVDGTFKRKKTAADKLADMRKKLEQRNEDMMQKKIEDIRIKEEMRLTNRLRDAFNGGLNNMQDEVQVKQAAPAPVVEAPAVVVEPPKKKSSVKVIPKFGMINISGDDIDFDSDLSTGISVEGMVSDRFSVGVSFGYSKMKIKQYNRDNYSSDWNTMPNDWNNYYGWDNNYQAQQYWYGMETWHDQNYGVRELDYSHMTLGINGKFYFTVDTRVKPFVGFGLELNKASLKYEQSEQMSYNPQSYGGYNTQFGDESFKSTYVSGSIGLGAEIAFTDYIGMVVEGNFAKGLSSGSTDSQASFIYNKDQEQLDRIGGSIEEASFLSLSAGMVISF